MMTNPSSAIHETLKNACNQNADVFKQAEKQLQEWEVQQGFYSILSEIFCDYSTDVNVRLLAVLYCKNGVDRYWRKTAPNAMKEEEKELLKERLLSNFKEPVKQIASQVAVLIAKIARVDCPRNWSNLLPALFENVQSTDEKVQEQALLVLHHVTTALASKRLPLDRLLFEQLTKNILGFIYGLWLSFMDQSSQESVQQHEDFVNLLGKSILTLKILRKQIAFGLKDPSENEYADSFMKQMFSRLSAILVFRQSMWGNKLVVEKCEKLIVILIKVMLDMIDLHPAAFIPYIKPALEFIVTYNFSQYDKGVIFESFTVKCFNLMRCIIQCSLYKPLEDPSDLTEPLRIEACKAKMEFFSLPTLSEICRRIVLQYFLLTSDELNSWDTDPEEFFQDEGGDSYRYSLKPCTENLFLFLFKENRLSLSPVLVEMMQTQIQIQQASDPNDIMAVLQKDAVYKAVGLAAFDLFDDINFDDLFTHHLLLELQNKHINYRIIRRRVTWLCAQWVGVKMSASLRPALYEALIPLMEKNEDLVVRLEAALTLKNAIDDFEFNTNQFLPYLETSFSLLFCLLQDGRECDTKMAVLNVIAFMIERVGSKIQQHSTGFLQYLPGLWQDAAEHHMLQCSILTTLIHLVEGFGSRCSCMYGFLLPIIQISTDVTKESYIYLVEDGLELWHTTLRNSSTSTEYILQMFANMRHLLELGTENLQMCLKIIEDYVLLCPVEFMQMYSNELVHSLGSLMTDIKTEGQVLVLKVIEVIFKAFPIEGPAAFSSLLPNFITALIKNEEDPPVLVMYLVIFARILLQNQTFTFSLVNALAVDYQKDSESFLGMLIDIICDRIDTLAFPEKRKLCALSVASLLSVDSVVVKEKFCAIICLCVEVLHDVMRIPVDEDPTIQLDSLVLNDEDEESGDGTEFVCDNTEEEIITEHDRRKTKLSKKDPVHSVALRDYLMSQLRSCQLLHGEVVFNQLMDTVDSEIIKQFHEFTSIK